MCQRAHLLPSGPPDAEGSILYRAQTADCRPCPLRASCVGASRGAKALWASTYRLELERAARINQTVRYAREQRRRQTVIEGVFAHLDQLGGKGAHVRGLERINRRNTVLALAHTILKAMSKRRFWPRAAGAQPVGQDVGSRRRSPGDSGCSGPAREAPATPNGTSPSTDVVNTLRRSPLRDACRLT